jgi:hypothetical protein
LRLALIVVLASVGATVAPARRVAKLDIDAGDGV